MRRHLAAPASGSVGTTTKTVAVELGALAFGALGGGEEPLEAVGARVEVAIGAYLSHRGSGRPGWPYPGIVQEREPSGVVELDLVVDEATWRSLEVEARRHAVSVQQMVTHAALYYAAEMDAGRTAPRLLDELDGSAALNGRRLAR